MKRTFISFLLIFVLILSLSACGLSTACRHRDADDDGLCDECGESYSDGQDCRHRDADDDGLCDECRYEFSDGDELPPECEHDDSDGDDLCDKCGEEFDEDGDAPEDEHILHTMSEGVCTVCGLPESSEGLEFILNGDGRSYTCYSIGNCTESNIVIGVYKGLSVTDIDYSAFYSSPVPTTITLADCVRSIGEDAFGACGQLVSVSLGEGVEELGDTPFRESPISSIEVAESNPYFTSQSGALYSKDGKTLVAYPVGSEGVRFTVPDGVEVISSYAFALSDRLESIQIPSSVKEIGLLAFYNCSNLTEFVVNEENQSFKSLDDILYTADGKVLIQYPEAKLGEAFTTPPGLEEIYYSAFYSNDNLKALTIGSGVRLIYVQAFARSALSSVVIGGDVEKIDEGAFSSCDELTELSFTPGRKAVIGKSAFSFCTGLTTLSIPGNISEIGESAFNGCYTLDSLTISEGVEVIGAGAFSSCSSLPSVELPDSLKIIDRSAFEGCSSLASVSMPEVGVAVGQSAFRDCAPGLYTTHESLIYVGDATNPYAILIGTADSTLEGYVIHPEALAIGGEAFYGCIKLESISIPSGVLSIGINAFYNCTSLEIVLIPDSVEIIYYGIFNASEALRAVYFLGTEERLAEISLGQLFIPDKSPNAALYFYSENEPTGDGSFWHYDENGNILVW